MSFLEAMLRTLLDDHGHVQQAKVDSVKQFVESPDFDDAAVENQGAHDKMGDYFFTNAPGRSHLLSDIAKWFHQVVAAENKNGQGPGTRVCSTDPSGDDITPNGWMAAGFETRRFEGEPPRGPLTLDLDRYIAAFANRSPTSCALPSASNQTQFVRSPLSTSAGAAPAARRYAPDC